MFNRNPTLDPVLDVKREGYLAAGKEIRDNLLEDYKVSISKSEHLHANLLFTTHYGYCILKGICRLVTYVDPSIINISWRDLAVKLGYNDVDVKCITNLRGNTYDPTEEVLKYYAATNNDGTVGSILQALLDLGFLPALQHAEKHIEMLLAEVETGKGNVVETPINTDNEMKNILKATNFKPVIPAIFDPMPSKKVGVETVPCNSAFVTDAVQRSIQITETRARQRKQYCKYVLLSFASDGHITAQKVAATLRSTKNKRDVPIGVVMLCENEQQILKNPGQMIPEILAKMDFIVPVLTEGYFEALKQPNPRARLLDERYIQFVHNSLVSKYIHDRCLNAQVRPIIPKQTFDGIYNKEEFVYNSIFSAWKTDDETTALADCILKSRRNKFTSH